MPDLSLNAALPLTCPEPGSPSSPLRVFTLGGFRLFRDGLEIHTTSWGREKALHLFQFLLTTRGQRLHKEQVIDQLWPQLDIESGERDFKVAMNALVTVLEPGRKPRQPSRFIERSESTYALRLDDIWLDADAFERLVIRANRLEPGDPALALDCYQRAVDLFAGEYLPERRYEDWTSVERERLTTLGLATFIRLAHLSLETQPLESLRLTQRVLQIDPLWEDAYRVQMQAYFKLGNRPLALRTYETCARTIQEFYGVEPLPETRDVYQGILVYGES